MACRIGITTDLEAHKSYWESKCQDLRGWQVLAGPLTTKEKAQAQETRLAREFGCENAPGGDDPDDPTTQWWVYGFNHDGCSE
jgi:hypothetical protein